MCEVVEISDDDDDECVQLYPSQPSSNIKECSQSSHTTISSSLNSVAEDLYPADRKKVV